MSERSALDRTLVLCLGNRIRRDDGVGWRVADALLASPPLGAEVRMTALSGLYLLDEMEGFERVVVVDAVASGRNAPGTVSVFPLSEIRSAPGPSPHGLGLPTALRTAHALGAPIPSRVAAAVPVAAVRVRELLAEPNPEPTAFLSSVSRSGGLAVSRWFP
jgi:hydrogenase maturation protease